MDASVTTMGGTGSEKPHTNGIGTSTPTPPPPPPSAGNGIQVSMADIEKQKQEIVQKVLRRAEIAKATRSLQTRLALAGFKATRGWQSITLDVIEPHLVQEAEARKRKASEDLAKTSHKRRTSEAPAASKSANGSLFGTMLTGSLPSPKPRPTITTNLSSTSTTSSARGGAAVFPSSSGRGFTPRPGRPIKPLSTSDPAFARSATEYVDAANVLNSLSRAPSDASIIAGQQTVASPTSASMPNHHGIAGVAPPRSPVSHARRTAQLPEASTPGRGGSAASGATAGATNGGGRRSASQEEEEQEDAAELMLFLAASPSPQAKRTASAEHRPSQVGGGVQGRRLFADDAPPAAQRQLVSQGGSFGDLSSTTSGGSGAPGGMTPYPANPSTSTSFLSPSQPHSAALPPSHSHPTTTAPITIPSTHVQTHAMHQHHNPAPRLSHSFDPNDFLSLSPGLAGSAFSAAASATTGGASVAGATAVVSADAHHGFGAPW